MPRSDLLKQEDLFTRDVLELLFERMPMGIVVLDRKFHLVRYNATWVSYFELYKPATLPRARPGIGYFDLLPETRPIFEPIYRRAISGETVREKEVPVQTAGYTSYWNMVAAPIVHEGAIEGLLVVGTDVSEQVISERTLQQTLLELQHAYEEVEDRVEDRTRELRTLMTMQQALTSSLNINDVLHLIAREARRLTNTEIAGLFLPENDLLVLAALSSEHPIGIDPGYRMSLTNSITGTTFITGRIQRVDHVSAESGVDPNAIDKAKLRSLLAVPLLSGSRVIGVLSVGNKVSGALSEEDERLLTMMAPSAVIALENARMLMRASETAVAAERGRLARDLHDSVTQTLFSASLTAEVLPRIWARNADEGLLRLEKLRELTRSALAEMRTLLLELRPAALVEMPLSDLLRQLVEGIAGRTQIAIGLHLDAQTDPPAEVKIALYRIAQEALNNIAKHSKATSAEVALTQTGRRTVMTIADDGLGFDPAANRGNHLGLRIMRERADAVQARIAVQSTVRQGTTIRVEWGEQEKML